MTPRILFLDHAAVRGGAELYLLDLARAFRDTSHTLLFEDGPLLGDLHASGVWASVVSAPDRFLRVRKQTALHGALQAIPGLLRLSGHVARRARSFDVLFANSQKSFLVACGAGLLARRPVVWNLHDMLTAGHFSASNRRLVIALANLAAAHVIANSEATRRAFIDAGGPPDRVSVVYNGIDAAPFEHAPDIEAALRRDLRVPEAAPLVGVFSRLAPWKGQHVLLDALVDVPRAHVLLVGDALFSGDGDYATALDEQAQRLGIAHRVHRLGFRTDVPALMKACDIIAHTSVAPEPFGRVIVEGMLAERPVIATRAGGAVEIVEDGVTGCLVPPGNAAALADTLHQILSSSATDRAPMIRKAAGEAKRRFGPEQPIRGVAQVLRTIPRRSGPSPARSAVPSSAPSVSSPPVASHMH
jgi:glycosyltransferase involved in cell wall biosynthesis